MYWAEKNRKCEIELRFLKIDFEYSVLKRVSIFRALFNIPIFSYLQWLTWARPHLIPAACGLEATSSTRSGHQATLHSSMQTMQNSLLN